MFCFKKREGINLSKTKPKGIPLWLQVIAILLVGIIASVGVFFYIQDSNIERFTVKFADKDGNIIEEKVVRSGKGIVPPSFDTDLVFRGWSATLNNISSDIETHPSFYSIVEDNLIYFNSAYVREGGKFSIDLILSGNVNISEGEVILNFDNEVMTYKKFDGYGITKVEETNPGELTISFNSEKPLIEKTSLAQIEFYAEKKNVNYTQVDLKANKANLLINGDKQFADCATINNKIYFLQEVE